MTNPGCRLCGSTEVRPHFTVRGFALETCGRCGYVQVSEKPSEQTSALYGQAYFSHNKYQDPDILARENRRRLALLRRALPAAGGRVLDAGCGVGDFVALAATETGAGVWGTDIAEAGIAMAKQTHPELEDKFSASPIEKLNFPLESFDAICSWDVIEHIWDPAHDYQLLFRFLKPGGVLLLSTPNIGAPVARIMGKVWAFMTPPEHLGFFNKRSMRWLAERVLQGKLITWFSRGKWTNFGFVIYKLGRVLPWVWLAKLNAKLSGTHLSRLPLYIPTGDVQYAVVRKDP